MRPIERPPSTLAKIGAFLSGFGGGPAAVEQIRRQQLEPVERYEAQLQDYYQ
jgi:hypothetical protein